ncbi:MAG: ribulose-phosphate 3-epimerase [archaeon]
MVKVSASILSKNFSQEAVDSVKSADYLQLDIMDGEFVPQTTPWADAIDFLETNLPKEVHLMVMNPEEHVDDFIDAGADRIAFHIEATQNPEAVIGMIHVRGVKAGIAINPSTSVETIFPFLEEIEFVIVMSVEPGASGQNFKKSALEKIKVIKRRNPGVEVEIDGGIDDETARLAVDAGADIVVSDSFLQKGDPEKQIAILHSII